MKNFLIAFLFGAVLFSGSHVIFSQVSAQKPGQESECAQLRAQIEQYGGGQALQLPAYCNPNQIYTKITSWLYYIVGIVAVISIIYSGYLYMTARDNEGQLKKAKSTIIWTLAGVALALLATLIVGVVINLIVDNQIF